MSTSIPLHNKSSTKTPNQITTPTSRSSSSSLSSHLAMIELKQRILTSLSKLSDRDTHQIAIEDLEKIIQTLSNDGVPMLLNCLYEATNDPKPAVKKESLRLFSLLCASHSHSAATHLTKIIAHIVKRLKDSDSGVRDACRDSIGSLSSLYLKGEKAENSVVSLFVKPLFESMGENNKTVQSGAAICMGKIVESAKDPPTMAFQKLCPRISKFLNSPNFIAKASLLPVVSTLSQIGAIAPQCLDSLMQSIHDSLSSSDWATRKAAADALNALALHSSNLVKDGVNSTLTVLEACRFDKIKPVRDSVNEALQIWKKIAGKEDGASDDHRASSQAGETYEAADLAGKKDLPNNDERRHEMMLKSPSNSSSSTDQYLSTKGSNILDKAVEKFRKKAPLFTDKELNPEFFQKLETRGSGDLPVEVVVPRRCQNSSNMQNEEESEPSNRDPRQRVRSVYQPDDGSLDSKYRNPEKGNAGYNCRERDADDRSDLNQRDLSSTNMGFSKNGGQSESFGNNRGNWLAIQRQLLQLERQQAHLMNMLQDFMGGSHDSMVTLENRVRGLERVVDDMARDLSISTSRRGTSFMGGFDGSSNRTMSKYNGFSDYSSPKLGSGNDGRSAFGERYAPSDVRPSGIRGRGPPWRPDAPEAWDFQAYGKHAQLGSRRALGGVPVDSRSPRSDDTDQPGSRRAWDRGAGPVRFGEGPSARSVWQASKDEATLEAIRVAGDDNGAARNARVAMPEMIPEAIGDDGMQDRDPVWTAWSNAMDALHVGDMDAAFAEVLSIGDDQLLVKLMDRSGPVLDQLSNEVAIEVLQAIAQFLLEQNLYDISLSWIQQLGEISAENESDVLGIPMEVKREILLNLHEASSTIEVPEDWEGATPDQLLFHLASVWEIDLKQLEK